MLAETRIPNVEIRLATLDDLHDITELDAQITELHKLDYWQEMFQRYVERSEGHFLVAQMPGDIRSDAGDLHGVQGFIVGEVRAWEFGSHPCGWIMVVGVSPNHRVRGIGESLYNAIADKFRDDGVDKIRTMAARNDRLNMSFFRSQGMMAGPFIELEKSID
ncbi:MAG: GNAT family N-acetyltransferase [Rhodospirillaceae bacterium]|jgi:ribosomal protein S18 acetylase RimI-like enzyme|nr:GNAT family N-acetyltransferase [Rhodospirillaceae bacterium]